MRTGKASVEPIDQPSRFRNTNMNAVNDRKSVSEPVHGNFTHAGNPYPFLSRAAIYVQAFIVIELSLRHICMPVASACYDFSCESISNGYDQHLRRLEASLYYKTFQDRQLMQIIGKTDWPQIYLHVCVFYALIAL
jgi:hypothetical protein